jgi:hypothetical protein
VITKELEKAIFLGRVWIREWYPWMMVPSMPMHAVPLEVVKAAESGGKVAATQLRNLQRWSGSSLKKQNAYYHFSHKKILNSSTGRNQLPGERSLWGEGIFIQGLPRDSSIKP